MKIHYFINARFPTERAHGTQIMKMSEQFAKAGHDVCLVVPFKRNTTSIVDVFSYYSVSSIFKIVRLPSFDFLGMSYKCGRFFYWIDFYSFQLSVWLWSIFNRSDVVYTRDPYLLRFLPWGKHTRVIELHEIHKPSRSFISCLKKADKIIVLTSLMKQELVSIGISPQIIHVAPDGFDPDDFRNLPDQTQARGRLNLNSNDFIALYTGHLYGWKGVDTFAKAAPSVPAVTFISIGGIEPEYSQFVKEFSHIQNLKIIPFQDRMYIPTYLSAANVLVLPNSATSANSQKYTSPLKLFEYMATTKPIVASDLPALREILNESNAIFFKPDNPEDLARVIKKLEGDKILQDQISLQARKDVDRFTWSKRSEGILHHITSN